MSDQELRDIDDPDRPFRCTACHHRCFAFGGRCSRCNAPPHCLILVADEKIRAARPAARRAAMAAAAEAASKRTIFSAESPDLPPGSMD